jgi:protein AroM
LIGLATIGQSPREDVTQSMFDPDTADSVLQEGALDGLDAAGVSRLAPASAEHPLVTRLTTGEEVVVAKERIIPLLEASIQRLVDGGSTLVCVLCTGEFDLNHRSVRIVYPDRLIAGVVDALMPTGHLGVVIPHEGQSRSMTEKWKRPQRNVSIEVLSPYVAADSPASVFERLSDSGCEMVVLDCMGYTRELHELAQSASRGPVVLANGLVGSVLSSIVSVDQTR